MTYTEFCKRIEEEIATGDPLVFEMSEETINDLLAEAKKVSVCEGQLMLHFDDESGDGRLTPLALSLNNEFYCWELYQFGNQYSYAKVLLNTNSKIRTVPL